MRNNPSLSSSKEFLLSDLMRAENTLEQIRAILQITDDENVVAQVGLYVSAVKVLQHLMHVENKPLSHLIDYILENTKLPE